MTRTPITTLLTLLLLAALLAGSILSRLQVQYERRQEASVEEVLYLPSGKALKRASLGYSGLLADIYWTRAVQYFGSRHILKAAHYDLLYPLLDITTDLDPHLIVAYESGSIFLSQTPPEGAGQPEKAIALVEKGIHANPARWRLYFTLGFIYYTDLHDYKAAQSAFQHGSEIPGALPWMKVLAARMAEHGKDVNTSIALWSAVLENTKDKDIRNTAISHLDSIRADLDIMELDRRVNAYRERTGRYPVEWSDLIRAGLLQALPADPHGDPYKLQSNGVISVQDPKQFPFLNEWRYQ
jgi:tetratricopeptide (TPR) repeat protein